jgi:4-carboxymuconolactone decarboxylase
MYDSIVEGPRKGTPGMVDSEGRLGALMNVFLYAPPIGGRQAAFGASLRFQITLSRRATEIIILTVLHDAGCEYELAAHEWMGFEAGLTHDELDALRERRTPELTDPFERAVHRTTVRLIEARDLDDAEYQEAVDAIGERALVELTTLVGFYQLSSLQTRVFRIPRAAYTGTLRPARDAAAG